MCWITASRPPWAVRKAYLTPTPGSRVSRRSTGTYSCLLGQSRDRWKQSARDALGLLHQREPDRRGREHVQAGEGQEVGPVVGGDGRVLRRNLGKDDRELAVSHQGGSGVQALSCGKSTHGARDHPAADLPDDGQHDRQRHEPAHVAERAHVDREPEREEEERREDVPEAEEPLLDLVAHRRLGEHDTGDERSYRSGELQLLGDGRRADQEPEHREQEELQREPVERPVDRAGEPARDRETDRDEPERLRDEHERLGSLAPARCREAEQERDHDVFEDENRQYEVRFVVAETPTSSPRPRFAARSTVPPRPKWRPVRETLVSVNSRPRKKSRKTTPSSATKSVTSDGLMSESSVGSFGPSRRPARRYAGIAESPIRCATRPSTASRAIVTASSVRVTADHSPRSAG